MRHKLSQVTGITLLVVLLVACATPVAAPTNIPFTGTLVSPTSTTEPPTATTAPKPAWKGKLEKGQIISQALANNLIGDPATRDFYVYLPDGYDTSDERYPVLYALHGFGGDENELIPMGPELGKLTASGEAREMILVFPDASNKFGGSYLSSPTIGDYESYIAEELVAHIDANYRTLPHRDSRGITGCSMGGAGALHLAFMHPEVFSVAAPMSGLYDYEGDPWWDKSKKVLQHIPEDFDELAPLRIEPKWFLAAAAAGAPNPGKPPFYLDMPFEDVDGEIQIVPEVQQKIIAVDVVHDLQDHLSQPLRLRGLLIYHGEYDGYSPVERVRDFDKMLTELGVEHDYVEVNKASQGGHCNLDRTVVLRFISDHLAH